MSLSRLRRFGRPRLAALAAVAGVALGLAACSDPPPPEPAKAPGQVVSTWVSGAYGNFPADINAWAAWRGRPAGVAIVFTDRTNWRTITTPEWPLTAFTPDEWPGKLSIGQPLFPQDGNLAACARGDYDGHWADFGRSLVRYRRPDAYVRLGWEFNGTWFWWGATDVEQWKTCFRRAVTAMRSTDPHVLIDWNLSAHRDHLPGGGPGLYDAYPGDQYVDVVGVDAYDSYPPSLTEKLWDRQCHSAAGLCTAITFARAHGKKFSVPEWGVVRGQGGGGDNPRFIAKMYDTFTDNADVLAYEAYFSIAEKGNVDSSLLNPDLNPRSAEQYQRLFGNR